jgi:hypothetical protein
MLVKIMLFYITVCPFIFIISKEYGLPFLFFAVLEIELRAFRGLLLFYFFFRSFEKIIHYFIVE